MPNYNDMRDLESQIALMHAESQNKEDPLDAVRRELGLETAGVQQEPSCDSRDEGVEAQLASSIVSLIQSLDENILISVEVTVQKVY